MNIKREDAIFTMLQTLLLHQSLIAVVNEASVGRNGGGAYISFYAPRRRDGKYTEHRFVKIYDNDWWKLPLSITEEAKLRTHKAPIMEGVMKRTEDERMGLLWPIDNYEIVRFKFKSADEKEEWRFGGIVRSWPRKAEEDPVAETPAPKPAPTPVPPKPIPALGAPKPVAVPVVETPAQLFIPAGAAPKPVVFTSLDEALNYAVEAKIWPTLEETKIAYTNLKTEAVAKAKERNTQLVAAEMFAIWATHIQTIQKSRIAHGQKVPA